MGVESVGLLGRRGFQCAGGQTTHGREGHLLHVRQIDIQTRAIGTVRPATNNLAPAASQVGDRLQILGGKLTRCHVLGLLEVTPKHQTGFPALILSDPVGLAKPVLHPPSNALAYEPVAVAGYPVFRYVLTVLGRKGKKAQIPLAGC